MTAGAANLEWLRNQANTLVRRHVVDFADRSIDDLLNRAIEHGYRPTLRADLDPELGILADLYDLIAMSKGMTVRADRG